MKVNVKHLKHHLGSIKKHLEDAEASGESELIIGWIKGNISMLERVLEGEFKEGEQ